MYEPVDVEVQALCAKSTGSCLQRWFLPAPVGFVPVFVPWPSVELATPVFTASFFSPLRLRKAGRLESKLGDGDSGSSSAVVPLSFEHPLLPQVVLPALPTVDAEALPMPSGSESSEKPPPNIRIPFSWTREIVFSRVESVSQTESSPPNI
mmetsp:Transcript_88923/g.160344  ORF Transcript_88923/g.160344 Transcript_88923/m.160344 type:complete len:151 (+) Transcript_88923:152-604(+)